MCRTGGRRCPGCADTTALRKHNDRRRKNRRIKAGLIAAAEKAGYPAEEVDELRKLGPRAVKDWAEARGIDPEAFAGGDMPPIPGPGQQGPVAPVAAPAVAAADPEDPAVGGLKHTRDRELANAILGALRQVQADGASGGGHAAAGKADPPRPGRGGPARKGGRADRAPVQDAASPHESWRTQDMARQLEVISQRQGSHRDERALLGGLPIKDERVVQGGINETRRVELDNGVTGYFKPFDGLDSAAHGFGQSSAQQPIHEAAAWMLASRMGRPYEDLVPPCVVREVNGRMGSLAMERPGRNKRFVSRGSSPEWDSAAFFDALIGQQDRHPGNFLMAGDRISLIDHGFSFARSGDYCNYSWFQSDRTASAPELSSAELATLDALLDSPDLFGMEGVLEPGRAKALRRRAEAMRVTKRLLSTGTYE